MTESREDGLNAYEVQVLIGTSISGCNMPPDRVFDLPAAWKRLYVLGLIDRTDGLAIVTPAGEVRIAAMLSASSPPVGGSGEVVVKQLEWTTYLDHGTWKAKKPFGSSYFIEQRDDLKYDWNGKVFDELQDAQTACQVDYETRIRSALAAPVPNGGPEGAKPDYWALWSPSGMHIGLWSERKLAETAAEGFSAGYRIQPLYASPVTPEGLSGGDPKWPAYVPQVIEYEEGGYAQLLLEDAAVIHAEEMTVTVLRRMSSPEREILGFQWEIPFKEHG